MLRISGHSEVEIYSPQRASDEKISCPSLVLLRHCEHSLVNIFQQIGINVIYSLYNYRILFMAKSSGHNYWCETLWLP